MWLQPRFLKGSHTLNLGFLPEAGGAYSCHPLGSHLIEDHREIHVDAGGIQLHDALPWKQRLVRAISVPIFQEAFLFLPVPPPKSSHHDRRPHLGLPPHT